MLEREGNEEFLCSIYEILYMGNQLFFNIHMYLWNMPTRDEKNPRIKL